MHFIVQFVFNALTVAAKVNLLPHEFQNIIPERVVVSTLFKPSYKFLPHPF